MGEVSVGLSPWAAVAQISAAYSASLTVNTFASPLDFPLL